MLAFRPFVPKTWRATYEGQKGLARLAGAMREQKQALASL